MVLKESQEVKEKRGRRRQSTERSAGAKYGVGDTSGEENDYRGRMVDSDSDSGSEEGVSEGELEWLEKDIGTMIEKEDPQAKTRKLLKDVLTQLGTVRGKKTGVKKSEDVKSFRAGYTTMPANVNSFWRMKRLFASVETGYNSGSDPDYEPGDEVEQVTRPRDTSGTADSSFTSGVASSVAGGKEAKRDRLNSTASTAATLAKRADRVRAETGGKKLPYWVRALSLPEKFDSETGKFVPMDKGYSEERDPDYTLPETDIEAELSDEAGMDELEIDELELLVKEALEELPDDIVEGKYKTGQKVVSPVKVTLTPSKEGADDPQEEILTLDSEEEEPAKERPPALWVRELMLTEQPELYDSAEDPEFVPPPVIYETDQEYDEYSDGGDKIPAEEVTNLLSEQKTPLVPPSTYIPIWVPVASAAEKIARAKEQIMELGEGVDDKETSKSETSGKDTDSNGQKIDEATTAAKAVPKPLDTGTGLTPAMRNMKVDRTSSEDGDGLEVPKPKRERKKSKAKSGDGDKSDGSVDVKLPEEFGKDGTAESEDEVDDKAPKVACGEPKTPTKSDAKTTPGKGDAKATKEAVETLAFGGLVTNYPGKDAAKPQTPEKGKKSPSKKVKSPSKKVGVTKEESEKLSKEVD
eukprot:GFUD01042330.1.p1 GENE.GFUD01042330.1~~GFUD01042330.1.p1  ORF type:complete len:683 (+),score=224.01 GFUD01042330.1:137-2050(+)